MKILVFAMEKEARPLLDEVSIKATKRNGYATIYECDYLGHPFVIAISGIGKAFAASCLAALANTYTIDYIVNFGVAGTLDAEQAPLLSAVIASSCVEHDMDTSQIGDPVGLVSGINLVYLPCSKELGKTMEKVCLEKGIPCAYGLISSGDTFFAPVDMRKTEVIKRYHPLCIDMESAPFAQIAYAYHIPFLAVRLVSDHLHPETEYVKNTPECARRIKELALHLLIS